MCARTHAHILSILLMDTARCILEMRFKMRKYQMWERNGYRQEHATEMNVSSYTQSVANVFPYKVAPFLRDSTSGYHLRMVQFPMEGNTLYIIPNSVYKRFNIHVIYEYIRKEL